MPQVYEPKSEMPRIMASGVILSGDIVPATSIPKGMDVQTAIATSISYKM